MEDWTTAQALSPCCLLTVMKLFNFKSNRLNASCALFDKLYTQHGHAELTEENRYVKRSLFMAVFLVSSCVTQHNNVNERKLYWEDVVHSEIPIGSSYGDVERWAKSRRLQLAPGQIPDEVIAGLEYVPVNDLVCRGFGISLQLTLDAERNVTQESIRSFGNCL
jgi:hypothetical protein